METQISSVHFLNLLFSVVNSFSGKYFQKHLLAHIIIIAVCLRRERGPFLEGLSKTPGLILICSVQVKCSPHVIETPI